MNRRLLTSASRFVLIVRLASFAGDALAHIASGNYEGEHWLASFAVYLLSQYDPQKK